MISRSERRRIRRGRLPSVQQGQGHGERTYVPIKRTNKFGFDRLVEDDIDARARGEVRVGPDVWSR